MVREEGLLEWAIPRVANNMSKSVRYISFALLIFQAVKAWSSLRVATSVDCWVLLVSMY